jgi:hypothetical protein
VSCCAVSCCGVMCLLQVEPNRAKPAAVKIAIHYFADFSVIVGGNIFDRARHQELTACIALFERQLC